MKGIERNEYVPLNVDALLDSIGDSLLALEERREVSTIYRVPRLLRQVDQNWYEPQLISIGPYYHDKECLKPMKEQKLQHLQKILSRNEKVELKDYIEAIDKLEQQARNCYSESISEIKRDEFVEMMLLDGCFLVEIFLHNKEVETGATARTIYNEMWLLDFISHDMLLLENQLPYFILSCIFKLAVGDRNFCSMAELALDCFKYIPVMPLNHAASMKNHYHHLVDLFHHHCLPTTYKISESAAAAAAAAAAGGGGVIDCCCAGPVKAVIDCCCAGPVKAVIDCRCAGPVKAVIDCCWKKIAGPIKAIDRATSVFRGSHPEEESDQRKPPLSIPSAEEMEEAGIVLKRKKKRGSFLGIEFHKNNGVMEIPYFYFSDGLDSVFQNFVAFELCCYPHVEPFFMGYVLFMDDIIDTGKDVKILRRREILEHGLGSDEELVHVFNQMTRGIYFDAKDTPLAEQFEDVKYYCGKRRNVWRANLMHNYFNTPWAAISSVAAALLLLLTITQTFFTIFPRK